MNITSEKVLVTESRFLEIVSGNDPIWQVLQNHSVVYLIINHETQIEYTAIWFGNNHIGDISLEVA